jgi:hypothetical protein
MNFMPEQYGASIRETININDLADISDVKIDPTLPRAEREKSYLRQIRNPRLYRCNDSIVRSSYINTDISLKDRLKQYLLSDQGLILIEE